MHERFRAQRYDAVVVGSGPNGLAAAITLAREGLAVAMVEGAQVAGGGTRSAELTLPGFAHDVCSSVHPLGIASPFFRELALERYGLTWLHPDACAAHPMDDGPPALLEQRIDATAGTLDGDGRAWARLFEPFVAPFDRLLADSLGPLRFPRSPWLLARFGLKALRTANGLARASFRHDRAKALFAGIAGHSMLPFDAIASSAIGLMLGVAGHAMGWPIPRGGAQSLADALVASFVAHGGEIVKGVWVKDVAELPPARAYVFDVSPRSLVRIAASKLPRRYVTRIERFRMGPGIFKIDWALDGPIPWREHGCSRAATVHLGGTLEEIAASESAPHEAVIAERPYVLLVQPSLFDPSRAPPGKHTAWGYCHVPNGCAVDMTARIEAQVERFAPGFRDRVLARAVRAPADFERENPNYVGGDINGGLASLDQLFTRPIARLDPYATPAPDVFLCSASTPPGGGVHGMCGYWAARSVLRRAFGRRRLTGARATQDALDALDAQKTGQALQR